MKETPEQLKLEREITALERVLDFVKKELEEKKPEEKPVLLSPVALGVKEKEFS